MIVFDENILDGQRLLLAASGVAVRQIGYDLLPKGLKDDQIIVELRALRRPTFFTRDADFFDRTLCHGAYCLAVVKTNQYEVAAFVRRFLRHPAFDTQGKRLGTVVRIGPAGVVVWTKHRRTEIVERWPSPKSSKR